MLFPSTLLFYRGFVMYTPEQSSHKGTMPDSLMAFYLRSHSAVSSFLELENGWARMGEYYNDSKKSGSYSPFLT